MDPGLTPCCILPGVVEKQKYAPGGPSDDADDFYEPGFTCFGEFRPPMMGRMGSACGKGDTFGKGGGPGCLKSSGSSDLGMVRIFAFLPPPAKYSMESDRLKKQVEVRPSRTSRREGSLNLRAADATVR